jgi:hypothetical protein
LLFGSGNLFLRTGVLEEAVDLVGCTKEGSVQFPKYAFGYEVAY